MGTFPDWVRRGHNKKTLPLTGDYIDMFPSGTVSSSIYMSSDIPVQIYRRGEGGMI